MKCESTLTRGCDSHKIRHFQQKHKEVDPKLALKLVVPADHEEAKKIKSKSFKDKHSTQDVTRDVPEAKNLDCKKSVANKVTESTTAVPNRIQKTISFSDDDVGNEEYSATSLEKIQTDINQIKVILMYS